MKIPSIDKKHVRRFLMGNFSRMNAKYVTHIPLKNKPEGECTTVVDDYIKLEGGERVLGWAIWENPKILIEAEFHAIWKSPNGKLFDISPRHSLEKMPKRILFIEDANIEYIGKQIDNIREPLSKDPRIADFIKLKEEYFTETNKGDLAYRYGEIEATPQIMKIQRAMDEILMDVEYRPITS